MNELPFIRDSAKLQTELNRLKIQRNTAKTKSKRTYTLTKADRKYIHGKTDGKCHICGDLVPLDSFEADHVKSHSKGVEHLLDNFLPTCKTCNNYRWDYLPAEIKW